MVAGGGTRQTEGLASLARRGLIDRCAANEPPPQSFCLGVSELRRWHRSIGCAAVHSTVRDTIEYTVDQRLITPDGNHVVDLLKASN